MVTFFNFLYCLQQSCDRKLWAKKYGFGVVLHLARSQLLVSLLLPSLLTQICLWLCYPFEACRHQFCFVVVVCFFLSFSSTSKASPILLGGTIRSKSMLCRAKGWPELSTSSGFLQQACGKELLKKPVPPW